VATIFLQWYASNVSSIERNGSQSRVVEARDHRNDAALAATGWTCHNGSVPQITILDMNQPQNATDCPAGMTKLRLSIAGFGREAYWRLHESKVIVP
jgi:hypothetical protein